MPFAVSDPSQFRMGSSSLFSAAPQSCMSQLRASCYTRFADIRLPKFRPWRPAKSVMLRARDSKTTNSNVVLTEGVYQQVIP